MIDGEPLPLALGPSGCTLDHGELTAQRERYGQLSKHVQRIDRHGPSALVQFVETVDTTLLDQALAVERGCCSFLALAYNPSERTLSITAEPGRDGDVVILLAALDCAAAPGRATR